MSEIVFEGWIASHYSRELDVQQIPKDGWKYTRTSCGWAGHTPYVYTTRGRCAHNNREGTTDPYPIYDYSQMPEYPKWTLRNENPELFEKKATEWREASANKPIIGYRQSKCVIKKAKIEVIPNET